MDLLKPLFTSYMLNGAKWSCAPRPMMKDSSFDTSYVNGKNINELKTDANHEIMFDAAQCLRFGKDILMNVSTNNHLLGAKWLQNHLGDQYNVHTTALTDHHIDGSIMPLRPGKLLISPYGTKEKLHLLPKKLQSWDIIHCTDTENEKYDNELMLASGNININILSLDENTVVLFSPTGEPPKQLAKSLEQHGFNIVTQRLRHSKVFDGGLHCCTLDTIRDDKSEYFL